MIGKLKGIIDSLTEDIAVIDVNGVGYETFCSTRTLAALAPGEAAELVIEPHVREDHFHLYGFLSAQEREWFRLLTSVQRVGARMALTILGTHAPDAIASAILAKDTTAFSRISGIGPKLAERIVAELKDKVVRGPLPVTSGKPGAIREPGNGKQETFLQDTVSALLHLGYSRAEAQAAAAKAMRDTGEDASMDTLIKRSLKELA